MADTKWLKCRGRCQPGEAPVVCCRGFLYCAALRQVVAHRVNSRLRSTSVAFGAKRTLTALLTEPDL
jgi:hypothetical protein